MTHPAEQTLRNITIVKQALVNRRKITDIAESFGIHCTRVRFIVHRHCLRKNANKYHAGCRRRTLRPNCPEDPIPTLNWLRANKEAFL